MQAYPGIPPNGGVGWADRTIAGTIVYTIEPMCYRNAWGLKSLIRISNATGIPDSLRLLFGVNQQCFRFNLSLGCNTTEGIYFDNVSLAFVDKPVPSLPASASNSSRETTCG